MELEDELILAIQFGSLVLVLAGVGATYCLVYVEYHLRVEHEFYYACDTIHALFDWYFCSRFGGIPTINTDSGC